MVPLTCPQPPSCSNPPSEVTATSPSLVSCLPLLSLPGSVTTEVLLNMSAHALRDSGPSGPCVPPHSGHGGGQALAPHPTPTPTRPLASHAGFCMGPPNAGIRLPQVLCTCSSHCLYRPPCVSALYPIRAFVSLPTVTHWQPAPRPSLGDNPLWCPQSRLPLGHRFPVLSTALALVLGVPSTDRCPQTSAACEGLRGTVSLPTRGQDPRLSLIHI